MITGIQITWNPRLWNGHDGPWVAEPDYVQGCIFSKHIFIRRAVVTGSLNGYVTTPVGHSWYGKPYDYFCHVTVHGGVTYAGPAEDVGFSKNGFWAVGFDCAHFGDVCPALYQTAPMLANTGHYWNVNEVLRETLWLALQADNPHKDPEELSILMPEVEHGCRVPNSKGLYEWVWEKEIRQRGKSNDRLTQTGCCCK